MKVLILAQNHEFSCIEGVAELFAEGFLENSVSEVKVANINTDIGIKHIFEAIAAQDIDLVFSIYLNSLHFNIDGKTLFELLPTRYAVYFLDNPIYDLRRVNFFIENMPDNSAFIFPDADQERHMLTYLRDINCKNILTFFIPYGISSNITFEKEKFEKKIDVAVFATLDQQICQQFKLDDNYDGVFQVSEKENKLLGIRLKKLTEASEFYKKNGFNEDIIDIFEKVIEEKNTISNPLFNSVLQKLDSFLKRYRRAIVIREAINSAIENNFCISIYGTGWENLHIQSKNLTLHGPAQYKEQFSIFKNSKLIINVDPNWASGVHDRVFNAISSGAAVYTNGNKYTEMYFRDSYNMGLYKSVDDIKSKLYYHLSNAPEYVNNSHKTLNPLHSYKNRILPLVHP
jgi:hypothetical protein